MKKRFLSLLLALSLTLAFLIPAYAADVPTAEKDIRALLNRPTTAAEIQSLEQAVQFLDEKGINQQMLTSIEKLMEKTLSSISLIIMKSRLAYPTKLLKMAIRSSTLPKAISMILC